MADWSGLIERLRQAQIANGGDPIEHSCDHEEAALIERLRVNGWARVGRTTRLQDGVLFHDLALTPHGDAEWWKRWKSST